MKIDRYRGHGFFKETVVSVVAVAMVVIFFILMAAILLGCGQKQSEIRKYLNKTREMPFKKDVEKERPDPVKCPRCKRLCPEIDKPCCWCGNEKMRRPDGRID